MFYKIIQICQKKIKDSRCNKLTFQIIPKDNEKQDYNDFGNEMKSILNIVVKLYTATLRHAIVIYDYWLDYTVNEFSILDIKENCPKGVIEIF